MAKPHSADPRSADPFDAAERRRLVGELQAERGKHRNCALVTRWPGAGSVPRTLIDTRCEMCRLADRILNDGKRRKAPR